MTRPITNQGPDHDQLGSRFGRASAGYSECEYPLWNSENSYPVETTGQVRHLSVIPERDVYRLIMRSKLESAERFEEWVVSDVLPAFARTAAISSVRSKIRQS
ncbi:MAG: BRO-N domain-containing protein [Aeromonas sobria]|uniref:BRO-N domain-containing protein n=1 Tax=Aeromonas sobria TaxID=646 RepID=UPI003F41AE8E